MQKEEVQKSHSQTYEWIRLSKLLDMSIYELSHRGRKLHKENIMIIEENSAIKLSLIYMENDQTKAELLIVLSQFYFSFLMDSIIGST